MSALWNLNTKHRRDLQPPSQKSFICPMHIFLNKKTLLRHEICGLIQTDTRMVGEEDRDRGLMNTQTSSPCVCQPPIATEWDQISRPSAFHT